MSDINISSSDNNKPNSRSELGSPAWTKPTAGAATQTSMQPKADMQKFASSQGTTTPAETLDTMAEKVKGGALPLIDQAKNAVAGQLSQSKEQSADSLRDLAKALRGAGEQLEGNMVSPYVRKAASQIEKVSDYVRAIDTTQLRHGTESFAKRRPLLFVGGAVTLGLVAARFFKSSAPIAASGAPKS